MHHVVAPLILVSSRLPRTSPILGPTSPVTRPAFVAPHSPPLSRCARGWARRWWVTWGKHYHLTSRHNLPRTQVCSRGQKRMIRARSVHSARRTRNSHAATTQDTDATRSACGRPRTHTQGHKHKRTYSLGQLVRLYFELLGMYV